MEQLTEQQRMLRARISTAADQAVSRNFTENLIADRADAWTKALGHTPSTAELTTFTLNEFRGLMEDTLFRIMDGEQR